MSYLFGWGKPSMCESLAQSLALSTLGQKVLLSLVPYQDVAQPQSYLRSCTLDEMLN